MAKKVVARKSSVETSFLSKAFVLALSLAIPATLYLGQTTFFSSRKQIAPTVHQPTESMLETCHTHRYTTQIISLDPLLIYINNFTTFKEAEDLIALGESDFEDSFISRTSGNHRVTGRTSQSAPLDDDHPLVSCILQRARSFMGTMLQPDEPFSVPQLVRYDKGKKYDLHTDFWPQHQIIKDGSGRLFNRVASFFVFLRANCTEGETYFPLVDVLDRDMERSGSLAKLVEGKAERGEKDGEKMGIKFRPITGNGLFWVNMDREGKGDRRVVHAGLPVGNGEKVGMNLWPRKFYGWEED